MTDFGVPAQWQLRDHFVPKERYTSREFAGLERERLWLRTWQVACREEEIPRVGDFLEYKILDQSIVVIRRAPDTIRAFYNVCPHRGNKLVVDTGMAKEFRCTFHGWCFDLDGCNTKVPDREDFLPLSAADTALSPVKVGTWGGFVYVNLDPDAEPLEDFLFPAPRFLDPFRLDQLRFRWYKRVNVRANWKIVCDAFNENYHLCATHPQLMPAYDDATVSAPMGRHSRFYQDVPTHGMGLGFRNHRLPPKPDDDPRQLIADMMDTSARDIKALVSLREAEVADEFRTVEIPEGANPKAVYFDMVKERLLQDGVQWVELTPEQLNASHNWHLFPNNPGLYSPTGAVFYRMRPHEDGPDWCIFDIWALERYPQGQEPPLQREFFDRWQDHDDWGAVFRQDFINLEKVQEGLHQRGFRGLHFNTLKENSPFHHAEICDLYLFGQADLVRRPLPVEDAAREPANA